MKGCGQFGDLFTRNEFAFKMISLLKLKLDFILLLTFIVIQYIYLKKVIRKSGLSERSFSQTFETCGVYEGAGAGYLYLRGICRKIR